MDVIEELPQNKSSSKFSIGALLQLAINERISNSVSPDVIKEACTSNLPKGDQRESENFKLI